MTAGSSTGCKAFRRTGSSAADSRNDGPRDLRSSQVRSSSGGLRKGLGHRGVNSEYRNRPVGSSRSRRRSQRRTVMGPVGLVETEWHPRITSTCDAWSPKLLGRSVSASKDRDESYGRRSKDSRFHVQSRRSKVGESCWIAFSRADASKIAIAEKQIVVQQNQR